MGKFCTRRRWELGTRITASAAVLAGVLGCSHYVLAGSGGAPASHRTITAAAGDEDGDGVRDAIDECPAVKGLASNAGCPDADTDGDGIADRYDRCPKVAGLEDNHGCPDADSDGDGLVDRIDRCPFEPGDPQDLGCPSVARGREHDRDGDGIEDDKDGCPTRPETFNDYLDGDGCPDEVPASLRAVAGRFDISFHPGTTKLTAESQPILEHAAAALRLAPGVTVMIVGHTDDRGDWTDSTELSIGRAAAIRDYLVKCGVDPSRLSSTGHGPDEPVATNATAAGRAANRRTQFQVLSNGSLRAAVGR